MPNPVVTPAIAPALIPVLIKDFMASDEAVALRVWPIFAPVSITALIVREKRLASMAREVA
jgi:hypothetical protein